MPRNLILMRNCLGVNTRIECVIRPLAGELGLWTLLCAAGLVGAQPSVIKAQGPFHGSQVAEGVLVSVASSLAAQGYVEDTGPAIWCLHLQAELRRLNGERCRKLGDFQFRPDS